MKLIRRIIFGFGIMVAALCLGAITLFNWSAMGYKALAVPTGSMRPHINPGSIVLVHSVPNASLHVGDVITYASLTEKNKTITHRIIKTYLLDGKVPAYITQGDANPSPDRPIVGGQVQGKVIGSVPYAGSWLAWTHTIIGILIIIYLPALMVMIEEIKRLGEYYRQYMPYKTSLILSREKARADEAKGKFKFTAVPIISLLLLAGSVLFAFPVQAMLKSNTVTFGPNRLTVAKVVKPPKTCGKNTNNINVTANTTQNGTTGDVTNTNNTNTATSTSGDVNNTSNTGISISITNC